MKKLIAIAAILTSTYAVNAQTASSTATQTVNLALNNAIEITFTGNNTATGAPVTMTFNNVNDYANGVTSAANELKVRSNKAFGVTVKANAANFTYTGSTTPAPSMPVSGILGLKVNSNSTGGTVASPFSTSATAFLWSDFDRSPASSIPVSSGSNRRTAPSGNVRLITSSSAHSRLLRG